MTEALQPTVSYSYSFVLEFRIVNTQKEVGTVVESVRGNKRFPAVLEEVLSSLERVYQSPVEVLAVRHVVCHKQC